MKMTSRRDFLKAAGLAAAALCPPGASLLGKGAGADKPNLLFIMADDHTSQAWGCYGLRLSKYAKTPHIDRIAAEGALLKNSFCTNSICVPSRATILTGQYSHLNGATTLGGGLDPKVDNVAKRLQGAGYETAIVGKWHLKNQPAGFDYYNILHGQGRYHNPILFETGKDWRNGGTTHEGHSTDVITGQALKWLGGRGDKDKPFCLMCHFKAVHEPFYPHERFQKLYADVDIPEPRDLLAPKAPKGTVIQGWPLEILTERFTKGANKYAPPKLDVAGKDAVATRKATYQKFVKTYLRTVAGIDENVGRILKWLDETGQADNTVVIYTADQGYFLGEHNLFDKRLMLEESLRMPFVVRYPKEIPPRTVLNDIILNVDFAELMLDYAGADVPDSMQGRSFRANLTGKTPGDWRDAMYYHYWSNSAPRQAHYGIRTHEHKLIWYYGLVAGGRKPDDCWEFYDLKTDPNEYENRYKDPKYKTVIAALKKRLVSLRQEFRDTADPTKSPAPGKRKKRTKR